MGGVWLFQRVENCSQYNFEGRLFYEQNSNKVDQFYRLAIKLGKLNLAKESNIFSSTNITNVWHY